MGLGGEGETQTDEMERGYGEDDCYDKEEKCRERNGEDKVMRM
jgi:hypothetical protein